MNVVSVPVTVLENEAEAKRFLLDVGVQGPSLHPDVRNEDSRKRWNGWNHAQAVGTDVEGHIVEIESWHFAAGGVDFSTSQNGETGRLSSLAFDDFAWPIQVFPAIAVILHPEHTPTSEKSNA